MGIPLTGDFDRLGTNYGLHQYTVADVAELSALPTELWPDGNTVHVDSVKCLFVLETTAAAAVDMEIVATLESGRKWIRHAINLDAANPWQVQTTWYVHPVTGNDEATGGSVGTALKTFKEFTRRWRGSVVRANTQVYMLAAGGTLEGELDVSPTAWVALDGSLALTTLATAVIGTYTTTSVANNEFPLITVSGITDLTAYEGKRIRITAGARAGAWCWIAKINPDGLGVATARVSIPCTRTEMLTGTTGAAWQPNDEIVIEDCPGIECVSTLWPHARVCDVSISGSIIGQPITTPTQGSVLLGSYCNSSSNSMEMFVYGCRLASTWVFTVRGPYGVVSLCLCKGTGGTQFLARQQRLSNILIQDGYLECVGSPSELFGTIGVFDCNSGTKAALSAIGSSTVDASATLLGKGNAHLGIWVAEGAALGWPSTVSTPPNRLTGAAGDIAIGAPSASRAPMSWSQMPMWLKDANAGIFGAPSVVGQGGNTVADLAALALIGVYNYVDGERFWVRSTRCHWTLRTTADAVVAMERVATATAGRVWEREAPALPNSTWATQANWYVHPSTGSDEADGAASGTALLTVKEVFRRLRGVTLQQNTFVWVMAAGATLDGDGVGISYPQGLVIDGSQAATTILTTTVESFTDINTTTNEWKLLTLTGVSDMTPYVGKRVRVTSGARQHNIYHIAKENPDGLGLNVARISTSYLMDPTGVLGAAGTNPQDGDDVVVEDLPTIVGIPSMGVTGQGYLVVRSFNITNTTSYCIGNKTTSILSYLSGCRLELSSVVDWTITGCAWIRSSNASISVTRVHSVGVNYSAFIGTSPGISLSISHGYLVSAIVQSAGLRFSAGAVTNYIYVPSGVWDSTVADAAIVLTHCARVEVQAGGVLMGKGNTGFGLGMFEGCSIGGTSGSFLTPNITGTKGDFFVSNFYAPDTISWSMIPYWDTAFAAGVFVPLYSPGDEVVLSSDAATTVQTWTVTGFPASKRFLVPININAHIWSATEEGTMSCALDVIVTTNSGGVATLALNTTPAPDYSRLPAGFAPTMTLSVATNVLTVQITRPAGVACRVRPRKWFDRPMELQTV